jgi:hypothetical protein
MMRDRRFGGVWLYIFFNRSFTKCMRSCSSSLMIGLGATVPTLGCVKVFFSYLEAFSIPKSSVSHGNVFTISH